MSTQSEREAAARVWLTTDNGRHVLMNAIDSPSGWWMPDGTEIVDRDGMFGNTARAAWAEHIRALDAAQPAALTLEQARAMCREAGDVVTPKVPLVGGYSRPDLALAEMEAWAAMSYDDRAALLASAGLSYGTNLSGDARFRAEIARLRALGVTPAVLS